MGKVLILLQFQSRIVNPSWCHFLQNKICRYLQSENYGVLLSLWLYYSCIVIASQDLIILFHPFLYLFTPLLLILCHYLNLMIHSALSSWKGSGVVL